MADRAISELIAANQVTPTDLFVLEQSGVAKKLTGHTLENWLLAMADGHGGIQSIAKASTSGLVDTYRITFADTSTYDFTVTNGKSITKIAKTKTSGLVDTYTITYNDRTTSTFTVTNGAQGEKGDSQYVWIKYASQEPTESSHSFGDIPDNWIGIYSGASATAPTDWTQYEWFEIKGAKGDTGEPAALESFSVEYQVSDSGVIIPSGAWSASVPVVAQGKYMWTRTTQKYNTGDPVVSYSVSRMGMDGMGSVVSVAGVSPNAEGNVPLTAADVGALPNTGGSLTGALNMNGQPISGLNAPTANDQAANMGFVKQQVKNAAPRNLADNSDFTQFVAQAGVGGKHGTQSYAGDRWILDSGTVTGKANGNGNGYTNIKLNGTISQKVANPPSVGTAAVEMISGSAEISYANGKITITSSGGVIKNVRLFEGSYTDETMPKHHAKGYGTELAECMRYYINLPHNNTFLLGNSGDASGAAVRLILPLPVTMRVNPTVGSFKVNFATPYSPKNGLTYTPSSTVANLNSISFYGKTSDVVSSSPTYVNVMAQIAGAPLELLADLP